jgi:prepilin-type N-terminal cleavage/methylation domain-containing protein
MKTVRKDRRRLRPPGYTLIEVMVAVSILMVGVGAAAHLSLTIRKQEEANANVVRALNCLECAHRLYQLGLTPAEAAAVLPADPQLTLSTEASTLVVPAEGATLEGIDWVVTCTPVPGLSATRDFRVRSVRESIR